MNHTTVFAIGAIPERVLERRWSARMTAQLYGVRCRPRPHACRLRLRTLTGLSLAIIGTGVALKAADSPSVNWPAFLAQHDPRFDQLPSRWQEAPHFGNAMIGSMLYRAGDVLRLQVFRADVQDHRDDTWGWTAYSRPRFLIGHFDLHPAGKLTGCQWRMDLWNAELTGTITTDRGEIRIRHFAHAEDMALVTELTPTAGEGDLRWTWHPAPAQTSRPGYPTSETGKEEFARRYGAHYQQNLKPWQPNPPGRLEEHGETSVWIQDLLVGGQYATAWTEISRDGTQTHIATIANSHPATNAAAVALADIQRFRTVDRDACIRAHRDWWHAYYPQSFVSIPDSGLEALYWQTIYRLGCTSRSGRSMVDTSGLWFQGGPWPYITTDWNIQSAHWPVYCANRLDQGLELVNQLHEGREELVRAVRPVEWQQDSAYLPIAVARDMRGVRDGDKRYYDLVGNLPWTLSNAWMQYRYSMDDAMLREKLYPLLRRAINLYLHMVEEGPDGRLHLPPTYSPETQVWKDCNFDLALFKWGCLTLLKASSRLGIDDPLIPRWKQVAAKLVDFPSDEHGFRLGSDGTSPPEHRHFSHLLMIYPLYLVNIDQEGNMAVLQATSERARAVAGLPAMVETHVGSIAAALGQGDAALAGLKRLHADLLPSGLWACSGNPCIESTLGLANNVQNMLLQSWSDPAKEEAGPIRVFPALPSTWQDVEFHDLRAEGAFLVSARRRAGRTEWVRIKSLAGEPCRVRTDIPGIVRAQGARPFNVRTIAAGHYAIDLGRGEEVLLSTDEAPASAASGAVRPPVR